MAKPTRGPFAPTVSPLEVAIALLPAINLGLKWLEVVPKAKPYARALRRITRMGLDAQPTQLKKLYRRITK